MREVQQILELWAEAERSGETAVLATVVKTRGSSYRLPGARMLLTQNGQHAGSISGGCLEADLLKKAWWFTEAGAAAVQRYDTTAEGEIATSYGSGCNGVIHVLLERIEPGRAEILDLIRVVWNTRQPITVAHVIGPAARVGERFRLDIEGAAETRGKETFVELITPPVHLAVFGAGDDAKPLVELAKYLGWRVSVHDGRAHYARRDKFPKADEVRARPQAQSAAALEADAWTAAVIMSHSYSQDLDAVRELARKPLCYLGILGPRARTAQLLADAELQAPPISALHSPMGLDIGADGPHQVALAVIAEIQARINGREGGLLSEGSGPIHGSEEAGPREDADGVPGTVLA